MKIVGYCADSKGYLRSPEDKDDVWGADPIHGSRRQLLREDRFCWRPVNLSPTHHFKYRYKDLQEEDEMASKICGKQLFSKLLTCKSSKDLDKDGNEMCSFPRPLGGADGDGNKHFPTSGSTTKMSSRSSSTLDKDDPQFFDNTHSSSNRDFYDRSTVPCTTGDANASNCGGCNSTDKLFYQWNMDDGNGDLHRAVDSRDLSKVFFDATDAQAQRDEDRAPKTQVSTNTQGQKEGRDLMDNWTYSSDEEDEQDEEFAPVVIELLRQECNHYRGEAMALRAEINSIKQELGSLRQQMSGLAFHSDSVWV